MYTMPEHIYGYASIRTGHRKEELVANLQRTKIYHEFKNLMLAVDETELSAVPDSSIIENSMRFNPEDTVQVDIITSSRKGMYYKLDCIIEQAKKSFILFNTIIVVTSINAFGSIDNIKKYYRIFREANIGVLIPDYTRESALSEFSTCDFGFQPRSPIEYERAFELVNGLEDGDIQDNRGRIGSGYTTSFRVAFWLYELFKIPEKMAVAMAGCSKNGFHMKADSYEQTANYKEELELIEKHFDISDLVKRNRPVPENFEKLMQMYDDSNNLELSCIYCKIPMIFPIDYERLKLKHYGGKKELARCLKLYDENLINQFEEWVNAGNEATDFYTCCGMEQYLSSRPIYL